MSESVYLSTIGLPLVTLLFIFGMRYHAQVQQARARLANDEAYRKLAADTATAQAEMAISLNAVNASMGELKTRLATLERVLKEVE